ncbi:MAG: hypothetical protein H7306_26010 [Bacteriovorax sp.]|nr:hypothetical protein [Rhizobacter sp.]
MNAGSSGCTTSVLIFLHADTRLPLDAGTPARWRGAPRSAEAQGGRFDVAIDSPRPVMRIAEGLMNVGLLDQHPPGTKPSSYGRACSAGWAAFRTNR